MRSVFALYVPSQLPRRICTGESPMPAEDKDKYQWGHPDAKFLRDFFNLGIYRCPHCELTFHAPKRKSEE